MAGKKLTRGAAKRLDTYGEEGIFELYREHRSIIKLLANLPAEVGMMSTGPFYAWLKDDPTHGRWNRWQDTKAVIASDLVEEGLTIVDEANDGSVPAARLRSEYRRWIAERYDRAAYGKPDAQVNVAVGIDGDWLAGLKAVEAKTKAKRIEAKEADYEVVEDDS
jgi:DNA modification methylase